MSEFAAQALPTSLALQGLSTPVSYSKPTVLDDYVLVKRNTLTVPEKKDSAIVKTVVPSKDDECKNVSVRSPAAGPAPALQMSVKGMIGRKPIMVRLSQRVTLASSAATALTTVIPLQPSAASEWSSFASLFEEVKLVRADLHFRIDAASNSSPGLLAVLVHDPVSSTALTSVVAGSEFASRQLYGFGSSLAGSAGFAGPTVSSGLRTFPVTVPRGSVRSSSTATTFGDEWSPTSDVGNDYGWIKPYVEAANSGPVNVNGILDFFVEFRMRA